MAKRGGRKMKQKGGKASSDLWDSDLWGVVGFLLFLLFVAMVGGKPTPTPAAARVVINSGRN